MARLGLGLLLVLAAAGHAAPAHHHHHHHLRHIAPAAPLIAAAPKPDPTAPTAAPVPNMDASPPQASLPPDTPSLVPGNVQLHFPTLGDGYLPGSSASDVDNVLQPNVPGISVVVPLSSPTAPGPSDQAAP